MNLYNLTFFCAQYSMPSYSCSYEFHKLILDSYSSTRLIDRFYIPKKVSTLSEFEEKYQYVLLTISTNPNGLWTTVRSSNRGVSLQYQTST